MTVSDDEIERLCKSMKETAMRNTWQDSEKSKIKDVTKNVLVSWGCRRINPKRKIRLCEQVPRSCAMRIRRRAASTSCTAVAV